MPKPRFIVHDLAQAEAALRAAADCKVPVILESPPNAAQSWGAPYFLKLITAARGAVSGAQCEAILDCGDAAGVALEALRRGAKWLRVAGDAKVVADVTDIAAQMGGHVESGPRADMLDLDGVRDPYDAARRFIVGQRGDP